MSPKRLRRPNPRARIVPRDDAALSREFGNLSKTVTAHTRELEVQFQRIAQLQAELDALRRGFSAGDQKVIAEDQKIRRSG